MTGERAQLIERLREWADATDKSLSFLEAEYVEEATTETALLREAADALAAADEWMTPFEGSGIEWHEKEIGWKYTYQASDFSKLVVAVHEYEVRSLKAEAERDRLADELAEMSGFYLALQNEAEEAHQERDRLAAELAEARAALARVDGLAEALTEHRTDSGVRCVGEQIRKALAAVSGRQQESAA